MLRAKVLSGCVVGPVGMSIAVGVSNFDVVSRVLWL